MFVGQSASFLVLFFLRWPAWLQLLLPRLHGHLPMHGPDPERPVPFHASYNTQTFQDSTERSAGVRWWKLKHLPVGLMGLKSNKKEVKLGVGCVLGSAGDGEHVQEGFQVETR